MLLPRTCYASQSQQQQQLQDPGSAASMQPHGAYALPYPGSAMRPCQLRRADGCDALLRGGLRALFLVAPSFGQWLCATPTSYASSAVWSKAMVEALVLPARGSGVSYPACSRGQKSNYMCEHVSHTGLCTELHLPILLQIAAYLHPLLPQLLQGK